MIIGNEEISIEDMPSYISSSQQPYHMFQSMQDTLQQAMANRGQIMAAPNSPGTMNNQQNQWGQNGKK